MGWFVQLFIILPIRLLLPLTVVGLAHRVYQDGCVQLSLWNLHAFAEIGFYLWYLFHSNALNAMKATSDLYEYFDVDRQKFDPEDCLEDNLRDVGDVLSQVSGHQHELRRGEICAWFCNADDHGKPGKISDLRLGDVRAWLAWAFFKKDLRDVSEVVGEKLTRMVGKVENWMQYEFQPGRNQDVVPIRLSLDEIGSMSRPMIHYVVTHFGCVSAAYVCFRMRGFVKRRIGGMEYWSKSSKGAELAPAIVVISGIGIGLIAYMKMIDGLIVKYPTRRFILCDLPEYSMRFTTKVNIVSPRDRAVALASVIGERGAHVIGHSLGSVVISWLIRLAPEHTVKACTFIDPVCFHLFNSSVAANFVYRTPLTPLDCLVSYFVGKELYVSNALHRHFRWDLNWLHPKLLREIPTAVVLADHDHFVPSMAVERHLAINAKHVRVTILKDHSHAQFCVMKSSTAKVLDEIEVVDGELMKTSTKTRARRSRSKPRR